MRMSGHNIGFTYKELKSSKKAKLYEIKSNVSGKIFWQVITKDKFPDTWGENIYDLKEAVTKFNKL